MSVGEWNMKVDKCQIIASVKDLESQWLER